MSFIQSRKYILFSLGSYILAFLVVYIIPRLIWMPNNLSLPVSRTVGYATIGFGLIMVIIGIVFGYKSNKTKESLWGGNLLMAIGILIAINALAIFNLCTPAYNCQ